MLPVVRNGAAVIGPVVHRRRLRAGLRLAMVSAVFWGFAAALIGVGARIVGHGPLFGGSIALALRLIAVGAPIGFVGGLLLSTGLVLAAPRDPNRSLSAGRVAVVGASGGLLVFAVLRVLLLGAGISSVIVTGLAPAVVCGALGMATGLGMLGTANRAQLPRQAPAPRSLAR